MPGQNQTYIKYVNEVYKRGIHALAIKKFSGTAATSTSTATAAAAAAASADTKNTPVAPDSVKINAAITHFIRLRLLFLGMMTGHVEYVCTDPSAPITFPVSTTPKDGSYKIAVSPAVGATATGGSAGAPAISSTPVGAAPTATQSAAVRAILAGNNNNAAAGGEVKAD